MAGMVQPFLAWLIIEANKRVWAPVPAPRAAGGMTVGVELRRSFG